MKILRPLVTIKDRKRETVSILSYHPTFKKDVMRLFQEGYSDSFDEYDMEFIEKFLETQKESETQTCFLATVNGELVGASLIDKVDGPQDQWEISHIFTRKSLRRRGIGRILIGIQEEFLKDEMRLLIAKNPSILPEDVISYPFWLLTGFEYLFTWPKYFRDDLDAIVLGKRNPYYPIGKGIPENSGWEPSMIDSLTSKRISEEEYQRRLHNTKLTPEEKWGLGLIGRENVLSWNLKNKKEK